MKSASVLMKNTLLLAASNIVLRLFALLFQAYLASEIGAHRLGIFGIIASVEVVFATISISGARFSMTRLVAEEINRNNTYPLSLMRCAFGYALFFGLLSGGSLYFLSDTISVCYIGDVEAAFPLKLLALSMPAVSLGSCVEGYFTAKQKIFRIIVLMIASQLVRMAFVKLAFDTLLERGVYPPDILAAGATLAEVVFTGGICIIYLFESFGKNTDSSSGRYFPTLVKTALPLAISAYMRTGLSSLGQVIVPTSLKKSGMESISAFSIYGAITQMAMPVVMFPIAFLSALGEILVPRLTGAQVKNQKIGISYIVNRALRIGIIFSFGIMGVMFFYSGELGSAIYKSNEVGSYIGIFVPLIPIIYIDCVTDGCLKGLGQQVHSMVYNILEGVINIVLLMLLLPKMAIKGYIAVIYIKEIFNAFLSLKRLSVVTAVDIKLSVLICSGISVLGAWLLCNIVAMSGAVALKIVIYLFFYVLLLYVVNAVTRDDIKWIASMLKPKKI